MSYHMRLIAVAAAAATLVAGGNGAGNIDHDHHAPLEHHGGSHHTSETHNHADHDDHDDHDHHGHHDHQDHEDHDHGHSDHVHSEHKRHDHGDHDHHGHHDHQDHEDHDHGHGDHVHRKHSHHDHGHHRAKASMPPNWRGAYASALGMSAVSFIGVALLGVLKMPQLGAVVEYTCLAFAAAVLVADALLHLLPHALEGADHDDMSSLGLSAVAGAFALLVVPEVCEWHRHKHGHEIEASGIANLVVEMLHNFVDGIAIGLSYIAGPAAGLEASLAVAAHELPQELGDFMVLRAAGFALPRLLLWNFVASLTCVLGVAVAQYVGEEASALLQKHLMAFTAGSFLTLALNMIYPQVVASIQKHHSGPALARAKFLCLSVSVLAIGVLLKLGSMESSHAHGQHEHSGHSHGHSSHAGHSHRSEF